jgi:hypothetical protein
MSGALAARKHRSGKGGENDDLEDTPSSDGEERNRDSQKTNRLSKMEENDSRKVLSRTVDRSSKAATTITGSAGAVSKKTGARRVRRGSQHQRQNQRR